MVNQSIKKMKLLTILRNVDGQETYLDNNYKKAGAESKPKVKSTTAVPFQSAQVNLKKIKWQKTGHWQNILGKNAIIG